MKAPQHGFTLIEMLVVMSVGSLLMGLAIQALEQAMTISTNTNEQVDTARNLNRLVDQFRGDVRLATGAVVESPEQVLVRVHDSAIRYTFADNAVERVEFAREASVRRERYRLGNNRSLTFAQANPAEPVTLTIRAHTGLQHEPTRTDRVVVAAIGRRQRLINELNPAPTAIAAGLLDSTAVDVRPKASAYGSLNQAYSPSQAEEAP